MDSGLPIRVLLVEDNEAFRHAEKSLLALYPGLDVAGEAADGFEALRLTEELLPDLILMDIRMPGMNGLEATRRIKLEKPWVKVIVLTALDESVYASASSYSGADAFLSKDTMDHELFPLIERVIAPSGKAKTAS